MRGGRFPSRWFAVLSVALAALALAAPGTFSLASTGSRHSSEIGRVLRLHDLRPGFVVGDFGCGRFGAEGVEPQLEEFIYGRRPRGCIAKYGRLYPVPGKRPDPPQAMAMVIDVRSPAAVAEAEAVMPELIALETGIHPEEVQPTASIGVATRLFHGGNANNANARSAAFVWRQGTRFGMAMAAGLPLAAADRTAARLARIQLRHMRSPGPYPESARDDVLVPLDNPAIKLPVYWLGRKFALGDGEPLELTEIFTQLREGEAPPGTRMELWYEGGLRLATWTAASWRVYSGSKLGRELLTWHCTETTTVPLAGGEATIYSGYTQDYASCPSKPPSAFAAVVRLGGVVLGLNLPVCYSCVEGPLSAAQLETVVRGLRLRPPRHFGGR